VAFASDVLDHGAPELIEAVERGEVAVSTAADIAKKPKAEQRVIVARGPTEILHAAKQIRQERRQDNLERRAEVAARLVKPPPGKYSCLVIDPPWPMEKIERDERPNQVGFDYPTMDEAALAALKVPDWAADDAHLYLWTTHKFLPMALRLAEHWGFRYQCLMTWVKPVGMTPFSWMYSTEHVLFCRRGNLPLLKMGERLDFAAPTTGHSRKPDTFFDIVRRVSPGPRIEVFARDRREGFDAWGNEAAA
jgi:N6-adenosine-specific RNA methylase IME4